MMGFRFWICFLFFTSVCGVRGAVVMLERGRELLGTSISDATGWEVTGAGGLNVSDGNAEVLSYNAQVVASRVNQKHESYVRGDYFYSDVKNEEVLNSLRLSAQQNRMLNDAYYVGGVVTYDTDQVAEVAYRMDVAALAGYYLLKDERARLSFEAGLGYAWQDVEGVGDDFVSVRLAERFSRRIFSRTKLWQALVIEPRASEYQDQLVRFELGLDMQLSKHWAVRSQLRRQWNRTAGGGRQRGEEVVTLGLAYSLKGVPALAAEVDFPNLKRVKRKKLAAVRKIQKKKKSGWVTTASFTHVMTAGNARSRQMNVDVLSAFYAMDYEWFLSGSQRLTTSGGKTTGERTVGDLQCNLLLSRDYFYGGNVGYLRDFATDLGYRVTPNVVAGKYLVKSDRVRWSLEAGPGLVSENVGGVRKNYAAAQMANRFAWMVNERCTIGQTSVLNADLATRKNRILTSQAYVDLDVTERLSWRTSLAYLYDSTPTRKLERHDTVLSGGISWRF